MNVKTNRYDSLSDNELLENYYQSKHPQWIGILLERYTLLLLGVCMKYLKNEDEAKDAVQQVFLKVLIEVAKYKIDFFKSWLYMVAKNHCLMKLRDRPGKTSTELHDNLAVAAGMEPDTGELWQNDKTIELMEAALKELNREQQQCVTLFYLQKKSYQEISEQTGYSLMQVKSYIQNGKRNMKILIEKKINDTVSKDDR